MRAYNKRAVWVDNVKVIACILVVLGHFFQSMVKSQVIPESFVYSWLNDSIYCFHVPLFFICSGYLFQRYSKVYTFEYWKNNVIKKLIALGVPYLVFSTITWLLKKAFSSMINTELDGLGYTLFVHPTPPYWYLFVLFICFLISLNTKSVEKQIIMLFIAIVLKLCNVFGLYTGVYLVDKVFANWVWFVFGMTLAHDLIRFCNAAIGVILFLIFIAGTLLVQFEIISGDFVTFILGMLACYSIISIVHSFFENGVQNKYWQFFAKYTMPIYLMHTLFAAPLRSVLLKIGVGNNIVHIILGLAISFCGPIVAMRIMEALKPVDFIVYPTRYIKIGKRS